MTDNPQSPSANTSTAPTNELEATRKTARRLVLAVCALALIAVAAGLTGHATLAFWCLPGVLVVGVAANAANQSARHRTNPVAASAARQMGEGVLLSVLALLLVGLLFALWLWHALGQWHG